jgi:hypothetical protein
MRVAKKWELYRCLAIVFYIPWFWKPFKWWASSLWRPSSASWCVSILVICYMSTYFIYMYSSLPFLLIFFLISINFSGRILFRWRCTKLVTCQREEHHCYVLTEVWCSKKYPEQPFYRCEFFYFILPTSYYKRNPLPFLFLLLIPNLLYVPCFWLLKHIMFIATVRSAVLALLYHCYHISSRVLVDDKLCYILSLC